MDLNRDELRRQMREIDAANRAVMPRWRSALAHIFGGDAQMTNQETAAVLGVPSPGRRTFFKVGGATMLGAAVLAACGNDDDGASTATTGDGGSAAGDGSLDLTLAKTAVSVELLAVDAYTAAAESGLVTDQAVADAALLFRDHHQEHADALNGVVTGAGEAGISERNAVLWDALVQPVLDGDPDQASIVALAYDLETAATQTYAFAGGTLSTPSLRSTIMTIGGIEARHATVLKMVAQAEPPTAVFPDSRAFFPGDNPLPEESLVS
jgi:hypothetical protein